MWIASPVNKTTDWSDVTLFVPSEASGEKRVGFLSSNLGTNSSIQTSGFSFYGQTAMRIEDDGTIDTLFTALTLDNGAVQIYWNDTSSGQVPITLRGNAPSSPPPSIPASIIINSTQA